MASIITVANQKGGVAKSTTVSALASILVSKGYKVLAIDLDPQGNLSDSVGADNINSHTIYEVLKKEVKSSEAIQQTEYYDIIPANIMLAGVEQEIMQIGKEQRLKETMEEINNIYDYIIIDTPPALNLLTINAFTYADEVIIPSNAGIFATTGINQLYETIQNVKKYCNNNLKIAGILLTRYNPKINISKDIKEVTLTLAEHMNTKVYNTYIRNSIIVEEAQANKQSLLEYKKMSTVTQDYEKFCDEYLNDFK